MSYFTTIRKSLKEWLYVNHSIIAFNTYLPESDSELAKIVKYCVEHTKQ